ncbi:MAG TPA: sigma-70 family RNA polymerase sigma factor [Bryobacteraceae bacterium]|nr:sigma-70 family RNA polymerase sigma factor [Bryobacteraceae bacterium]
MKSLPPGATDERLVAECLAGNEQAWSALIDKYKRLIYSVPVKYRASPEDAADIFQAVCLELFSELPRLRNVDSLRSWLITVASHKCLHWKRKREPLAEGEPDEMAGELAAEGTSLDMYEELEREQILRDAVRLLPPRCQEMIRLLFYETPSLPYAEVARRLGLATGSIGFIRGRCLRKLEHALVQMGFR